MAKTKSGKKDLDSYTIKGTSKVIRAGDCVLMRSSDSEKPPYVVRVEKIKADHRNNMRVRWYYRPEESIGGRRQFHDVKELFLSVVAGIDLNHGDIAAYLPDELGLLTDLVLFHINSNRFCGIVPRTFKHLRLLYELDISNNCFAGRFPDIVLQLAKLKFLDLRFNEFEGTVPKELFDKDLNVIFISDNCFNFNLPNNFGNSLSLSLSLFQGPTQCFCCL